MGMAASSRTRRTGLVAAVLLAVSGAVTGALWWRCHLTDTATLVGLVGGVFGGTGTWLTSSGYRDDRRAEEQAAPLLMVADSREAARIADTEHTETTTFNPRECAPEPCS